MSTDNNSSDCDIPEVVVTHNEGIQTPFGVTKTQKTDETMKGEKRVVVLTKTDSGIGVTVQSNIIVDVLKDSEAASRGLTTGMIIKKVGLHKTNSNISSSTLCRLISEQPMTFCMSILTPEDLLDPVQAERYFGPFHDTFQADDDDQSLDVMGALSVKNAAVFMLFLVFLITPILVMILSAIVAGPLAVIMGWSYSRGFWVSSSVFVTPIGGSPAYQLPPEDGSPLGGRILISMIGTWSAGLLGFLQLLVFPAIEPLFSWGFGERQPKKPTHQRWIQSHVRTASPWRMIGEELPDELIAGRLENRINEAKATELDPVAVWLHRQRTGRRATLPLNTIILPAGATSPNTLSHRGSSCSRRTSICSQEEMYVFISTK